MPPPRCKHFDDDGKPIRGGCTHPCCGFVHPDDPRWKYAERKQMASTRSGFRPRGLVSSHSSSWGRPPPRLPEKSSEPEWDTSSWSAKSTTTPLPSSSTSTWIGTHSDDAWGSKPGESSASSQKDSTIGDAFGRGTSSSTGSAWERKDESQDVEQNDGFGRAQNKDSSWNGWDSWGDSSTHDAGWGKNWAPPTTDNGQGKYKTENTEWNVGDREQKTKNEINIDDERSPLGAVNLYTNAIAPSSKGKENATEMGPSTHATSGNQPDVDGRRLRTDLTAALKKEYQCPLNTIHHRRDKSDTDPSALAITPSLDSAQLSNASSTRSGPPSRSDIFATTIKYIQQAVRLKIGLDEISTMDQKWKNAQKSSSYARAPPRARQVLDEKRSKFKAEISELTRRFNASVSDLASLPDLTDSANASPKIDIREVMAYTARMKEWMEELRMYHRSLVARKQEQEKIRAQIQAQIQATAIKPATETGMFSAKEIQERVAELERRAEQLSEYFFLDKYTRVLDVEVAPLFEAVMTSGDWNNNHVKKRKQEVDDKAEALRKSLENEAMTTADLYRKVYAHASEIEALLAEKQQLDEERARALAMLEQFERWQREDEEEIRSLTEQIQRLYLIRRPSPPPFDPQEPEMLTELRSLVVKIVEREITPIVQAYREGFTQHHQGFVDQLYQKLQPALDLMQEMSRQAGIEVATGRPAALRPQQLSGR